MAKNSSIGPVRVDDQMKADMDRMVAAAGPDATEADVVRAALREYFARHLPPAAG
jgi:Arc/MetJ-type ribon-helix-helix transcriptional regulator